MCPMLGFAQSNNSKHCVRLCSLPICLSKLNLPNVQDQKLLTDALAFYR